MRLRTLAALTCASVFVGCATTFQHGDLADEALRWGERLTVATRVNENWAVNCNTDAVSRTRRCFAATFGRPMSSSGGGFGTKSIPFQVYFYNKQGPFLMVGLHTYPGRRPEIRIDDDSAAEFINDNAGVSPAGAHPEIVQRLLTARVVRARYDTWPDGSHDMIVDVTGFGEAWARLQQLLTGAIAPSDTLSPPRS